jgi:hypothetical protein
VKRKTLIDVVEEQLAINHTVTDNHDVSLRGAAQQAYWRCKRDNCILQLIRELTVFVPKEVALSPEAQRGLSYLVEKRYRRTKDELVGYQ